MLIDALKTKYRLNDLLGMTNLAKSSYFYQKESLKKPDKYKDLKNLLKSVFTENQRRYGYRRLHSELKSKGVRISEKVIRRIMKEEYLEVLARKKRRYNSYKGEISPAVENHFFLLSYNHYTFFSQMVLLS